MKKQEFITFNSIEILVNSFSYYVQSKHILQTCRDNDTEYIECITYMKVAGDEDPVLGIPFFYSNYIIYDADNIRISKIQSNKEL